MNINPSSPPVLLAPNKSRLQRFFTEVKKQRFLLLLILPGVIWFIVFRYMSIAGLSLAFTDAGRKFNQINFIDFANFQRLFNDPLFWTAFRNTLIISALNLTFYFPIPIVFALLMNEMRNVNLKRTLQFVYYIPYFFSWVVVYGIFTTLLSPSSGLVNHIIKALGGQEIYFFTKPEWFRQILVTSLIWRNVGYGMVIYIATLETIDPQLYDAATVDGANYWQKMIHITMPGLATTIAVMLLLNVSHILRAFDQIISMETDSVRDVSDVIMTYSFRMGLNNLDIGYATTISSFTAVVTFVLILGLNFLSKRVMGESIL